MRNALLVSVFAAFSLSACGGSNGGDNPVLPTSGGVNLPTSTNHAPVLAVANADKMATVGQSFSYDASQGQTTFTDQDGDSLSYSVVFDPDNSGFSASNGIVSGAPNQEGVVTVSITASDGSLTSAADVFSISSVAANNAPVLDVANPDRTGHVGQLFQYDASQGGTSFTDADGDALSYTVSFTPDDGTFSVDSHGLISGTPSAEGVVTVSIVASDGDLSSDADEFTISITSLNTAPILAVENPDQLATVGQILQYDATQGETSFTDADGDALTYTVSFTPDDGTFTASAGAISGTPSAQGVVTVSISATDGDLTSEVDEFLITSSAGLSAVERVFGGNIDLASLLDYENPVVPDYIRAPNVVNSPVTDAGAMLGRVLFYDPALSIDDTVSCASCHQQENAFGDTAVVSSGVDGGVTGRHSMRLVNVIYSDEQAFFWNERAVDLEDQVTDPIRDHNEHGFSGQNGRPSFDDLVIKLEGLDYYQELFTFVFGTPEITEARMQSALAQFVNSIVSFDSPFDVGRAQVATPEEIFPNYSFDEGEGKRLFMTGPQDGGAGCRRCHADPVFSVFEDSGHIGVIGVAGDASATDLTNTRSPSLRETFKLNNDAIGPFMHDGSLATMRDVIDHYTNIPTPTEEPLRTEFLNTIDGQLLQFGEVESFTLTDVEKDQIEAFLRTLTGQNLYTDEKWSDPFPNQ